MSDYPASYYKLMLQQKYKNELSSPYTDQGIVNDINKAIEEKTFEFVQKQQAAHRDNINKLKKEMS